MNPTHRTRLWTWLSAALLAGAVLGGYEIFLRSRGVMPSVTDDKELWALVRGDVYAASRLLALCGASRIQLGFSLDEARALDPDLNVVQLAIDGTNAVASFRDLASDPHFHGTVLFSILPAVLGHQVWEDQTPWVRRRATSWTLNDELNRRWRSELQARFSVLAPEAEFSRALTRFLSSGELPEQHMVFRADRYRTAEYSELPREAYAAYRLDRDRRGLTNAPRGAAYDEWIKDVDAIDAMTRQIQARGGRVVILHDHLSGEYRCLYDAAFPRERFWDVIVGRSAATCIHADEMPEIAALDCPDGPHIDSKDAPLFTRVLLREMSRRNVLP